MSGVVGATTTGSAVLAPSRRRAAARWRASYSFLYGQQNASIPCTRSGNARSRWWSIRERSSASVSWASASRSRKSRVRSLLRQAESSEGVMRGALHLARKMPVVFYQRRELTLMRALVRPVYLAVALAAAAPACAAKLDAQDAALLAARDAFEANHRAKIGR